MIPSYHMLKVFVTIPQRPKFHQMTFDDFLFGGDDAFKDRGPMYDPTGTITRYVNMYPPMYAKHRRERYTETLRLINVLRNFNSRHQNLIDVEDKSTLYHTFYLPKKSGHGMRRIDEPNDELMNALRELKGIFELDFRATHHTSAHAYAKGRSNVSCMKKHQQNKSNWYAKFDFSNFFGSITLDWTIDTLQNIFPFSEIYYFDPQSVDEVLRKSLSIAFLNGGLPQGTPLSPMLTNILMIPFDHLVTNHLNGVTKKKFKDGAEKDVRFVYTRYSDDIQISSRTDFDFREVEAYIQKKLEELGAPMRLNEEKTRYGSKNGRNWNLGVMINKDNEMTVGHKAKKRYKVFLKSYAEGVASGVEPDLGELQYVLGLHSYYASVEGPRIKELESEYSKRFGFDIIQHMEDKKNAMAKGLA